MYNPAGVKTSPDLPIPGQMKAWVLGDPDREACTRSRTR